MSISDDLLEQQEHDGAPECPHDEGTRYQSYDSDGCGFYIWKCAACRLSGKLGRRRGGLDNEGTRFRLLRSQMIAVGRRGLLKALEGSYDHVRNMLVRWQGANG